ncbi:MAG: OmpW/AlkL family protein [Betaproteobacteria bacterium]
MRKFTRALTAAAALTAASAVMAQEAANTVAVGYVRALFNDSSSDLTGPPGTTPPGLKVGIEDLNALGLLYARRLGGGWSAIFQFGVPSTVSYVGAGSGAMLGEAASAKGWTPALLVGYTFESVPVVKPYLAAGAAYTWYTDEKASAAYNAAFFGTSTSASFKSSFGPVAKVGAEVPLGSNWLFDFSYSYYWIKTTATLTTATPGLGSVPRQIDVTANPGALAFNVGYRF